MTSTTALGTVGTTIQAPGGFQTNAINPYSGNNLQMGATGQTMTVPGLIQTSTILPSSGTDIQLGSAASNIYTPGSYKANTLIPYSGTNTTLGSAAQTVSIPGTLLTNTITPFSGTDLVLGTNTTNADFPGAIKANTINTYSGTALSIGNASTTVSVPGTASIAALKLATTGGTSSSLTYYEEFTGTGTLSQSSTTAASSITYNVVRVGRTVTVWFPKTVLSGMGTNTLNDLVLSGFPTRFLSGGSTFQMSIPGWYGTTGNVANTMVGVFVNTTQISFRPSAYELNAYWPSDAGIYATQFSYIIPLQ